MAINPAMAKALLKLKGVRTDEDVVQPVTQTPIDPTMAVQAPVQAIQQQATQRNLQLKPMSFLDQFADTGDRLKKLSQEAQWKEQFSGKDYKPLDPETTKYLTESFDQLPTTKAQRAGLEKQNELLSQYMNLPKRTNVAPLLALAEAWGNVPGLSASYTKPDTEQDRLLKNLGAQKEISSGQKALADDLVAYMRAQTPGYNQYGTTASQLLGLVSGTQPPRGSGAADPEERMLAREVRGKVDKLTTDMGDVGAKFDNIDAAFATKNNANLKSALYQYARAVNDEKGPLTRDDLVNIMPSSLGRSWMDLEAWFNNGAAEVPKELVEPLKKMVELAKKRTLEKAQEKFKALEGMYSGVPGEGRGSRKALQTGREAVDRYGSKVTKPPEKTQFQKNHEEFMKMMDPKKGN